MYVIDPLSDPRWTPFVERHHQACAFHTLGWIRALSATYNYQAFVVTSAPPGTELTDAIPVCRVESWATGRRLVSLPFTDHCQPLFHPTAVGEAVDFLGELARQEGYKFFEIRPAVPLTDAPAWDENRSAAYAIHWLDLTPSLETLFNNLHKDSIQRKIRRAQRETLGYVEGRSPEIISQFYALMLRTRRRHQLPPQPKIWFDNLAREIGDSIQFRIATKEGVPVAAIVTLTHPNSVIYKYGCSDERYHSTGSMPFLFWRLIQEAKGQGTDLLDFGRSDLDNPGLIRFKDRWGTRRSDLVYYRFPAPERKGSSTRPGVGAAKAVFARLPDGLLELAGRMIYRHIG